MTSKAGYLLFPANFLIYHIHYLIPCTTEAQGWKVYFLSLFAVLTVVALSNLLKPSNGLRFSQVATGALFGAEFVKELFGVNFAGAYIDSVTVLLFGALSGFLFVVFAKK